MHTSRGSLGHNTQCLIDLRDLSETDELQELRVIGIQVVTKWSATDDICQVFCVSNQLLWTQNGPLGNTASDVVGSR